MFAIPPHPAYEVLINKDGALAMIVRGWLSRDEATRLCNYMRENIPFTKKKLLMMGKWIDEPRRTFYCGQSGLKHAYTGGENELKGWHPAIEPLKDRIVRETGIKVNSQLSNEYIDGSDYIGYHSDKEAGKTMFNSAVFTVTLGDSNRDFYFKRKDLSEDTIKCVLYNGDAVIMFGRTQELYTHSLPKRAHADYRISLTFRCLGP